ncbi:MAG: YbaB/EbfC family nucleoid-associated protein, partial [Chloroflexi bacterium]|nr:YbaB/EbfC family nucleoid-associated protein [Chloroflexota bacterium]
MASKGKKRFRGAPGGGDLPMMRQIEALQAQLARAQAELAEEVVVGSAGGGVVTVEMTGSQEVRAIHIAPEVVDPEDVEMLQDLILLAFIDAQAKVTELAERRMGPLTG